MVQIWLGQMDTVCVSTYLLLFLLKPDILTASMYTFQYLAGICNIKKKSPETSGLYFKRIIHFMVVLLHSLSSIWSWHAIHTKNGAEAREFISVVSPRYTVNQVEHCVHAFHQTVEASLLRLRLLYCDMQGLQLAFSLSYNLRSTRNTIKEQCTLNLRFLNYNLSIRWCMSSQFIQG